MSSRHVVMAADHAGFELKETLKTWMESTGWTVLDLGTHSDERTDYPDYADQLSLKMKEATIDWGVLICGSGQGMAIRANRYSHIRAALCFTPELAALSRRHNDANVLCLGSRFVKLDEAQKIWEAFSTTDFEGGRHQGRVQKLSKQLP